MQREKVLGKFRNKKLSILVATDVAARGIDVADITLVVNYDIPNKAETYVHRIGRTGRAGAEGEAVSLVCVDENKLLVDIEKLIRRPLPSSQVSGFEVDPRIQAEPIPNGRNTPRGGGGGGRSGGGQPRSGGGQGSHHGGPGAPRAPSATPRPAGQGQSRAPKKPTSRHH